MGRILIAIVATSLLPASGVCDVVAVRSTTKVLERNVDVVGSDSATVEAASGEYEGFQIVVRAKGGDVKAVTATASDLSGPSGSTVPSSAVEMYLENYVHVEQTSACFEFLCPDCYKYPEYLRSTGDYPEQLIPFFDPYSEGHEAVAVPFDVPDGSFRTVWVDIQVPSDAAPGDYSGEVEVLSGKDVLATVPVTLHVWDYGMPAERHVGTSYGFSRNLVKKYHGGPDGPDDDEYARILDNYEQEVHRHRMDFTTYNPGLKFEFDDDGTLKPVDFAAYDAYIGPRVDGSYFPDGGGVNRFNLGMFRPGHGTMGMTDDQFALAAKAMAEHLDVKGWLDNVYLYSSDEPWIPSHFGAMEGIKETVGLLNKYTDLWKGSVLVTGPWMEILDGYVDIWCPVTPMYGDCLWPTGSWPGPEKYAELMEAGRQLWFYVCNANFPPVLGYDTDSPIGWEPRLVKWGAWAEKATGFLYWRINYWLEPDPWNVLANFEYFGDMYARNGDGILLYPGDHDGTTKGTGSPDGVAIDGPVVSYRMKQVRDGLEDWEMLILADQLGAGEWARAQVATVYRKFGEPLNDSFTISDPPWTLDEDALYAARRNVAEKIQYLLNPNVYEDPEAPPVPEATEPVDDASVEDSAVPDASGHGPDISAADAGVPAGQGGDCSVSDDGGSLPILLLAMMVMLCLKNCIVKQRNQ